jgi:cell division protein FtsZ
MTIEFAEVNAGPKIKVVGVGGGGSNAVNRMLSSDLQGVEFIVANTDIQALKASPVNKKIQLGAKLTKGLGAGADPQIGRKAAEEDPNEILEHLAGADMIFITAGLGGGTGTGGAPIIANLAKELGALAVGVVTKPFVFEGRKRAIQAEAGVKELEQVVDSLITIPNQKVLAITGEQTTLDEGFKMVDDVLLHAVQGIANLITVPGLINLDFADIRTIMSEKGTALMGVGVAKGDNRAREATLRAISCPLLEEVGIAGARGILLNITGGKDLTLHQVNEAASIVYEAAHKDANIIFGAGRDDNMCEEVKVTVVATGFASENKEAEMDKHPSTIDFRRYSNRVVKPSPVRPVQMEISAGDIGIYKFDKQDLEVPAFLRKKMD